MKITATWGFSSRSTIERYLTCTERSWKIHKYQKKDRERSFFEGSWKIVKVCDRSLTCTDRSWKIVKGPTSHICDEGRGGLGTSPPRQGADLSSSSLPSTKIKNGGHGWL